MQINKIFFLYTKILFPHKEETCLHASINHTQNAENKKKTSENNYFRILMAAFCILSLMHCLSSLWLATYLFRGFLYSLTETYISFTINNFHHFPLMISCRKLYCYTHHVSNVLFCRVWSWFWSSRLLIFNNLEKNCVLFISMVVYAISRLLIKQL